MNESFPMWARVAGFFLLLGTAIYLIVSPEQTANIPLITLLLAGAGAFAGITISGSGIGGKK